MRGEDKDTTIATGSPALAGDVLKSLTATGYLALQTYLGDTTDVEVTQGLVLNQGANDDSILSLKSSDVAHGITSAAETDTYANFSKASATAGGLAIDGFSEDEAGLALGGNVTNDNALKTTGGNGAITAIAYKKSGTTVGNMGADANLFVIRNNATTRFIFDAEGSGHSDVEWTTFDEHDDVGLLTGLEMAFRDPVKSAFGEFVRENRQRLQSLKLVNFEGDDVTHGMVNWTRLSMLLTGAVRQLGQRLTGTEQRLERMERLLLASA